MARVRPSGVPLKISAKKCSQLAILLEAAQPVEEVIVVYAVIAGRKDTVQRSVRSFLFPSRLNTNEI